MEKKKVSKAHMRATAKWEEANYDKALIRFPKGTKSRITAAGQSINGFVVRVVLDALDALDNEENNAIHHAKRHAKQEVTTMNEKILAAYDNIESPCQECEYRDDHFCRYYEETIVEDSPAVFIPCQRCEQEYGSLI